VQRLAVANGPNFLLRYAITIHRRYTWTDGRKDGRHAGCMACRGQSSYKLKPAVRQRSAIILAVFHETATRKTAEIGEMIRDSNQILLSSEQRCLQINQIFCFIWTDSYG